MVHPKAGQPHEPEPESGASTFAPDKGWGEQPSPLLQVELKALLPEADRAKLDEAFGKSAQELLSAGIEVGYSKEVKTGFKVGAKEGGYYISFSDADFDALLGEYLREKVSDMLFKA